MTRNRGKNDGGSPGPGAGAAVLLLLATVSVLAQTSNFAKLRMAGTLIASQYGNWGLEALTPVAAPGIHTVTLLASTAIMGDGEAIQPINANAPLLIDDPGRQETVVPIATQCAFAGAPCTFTANFTRAHLGRFVVRSATDGLQEAINDVGPRGGTVALTTDWNGTSAEIQAARGAANIAIVDRRAGQQSWYAWNGSAYQMAASTAADGSRTVRDLNAVRDADQYCAAPGVYDETCINNAILSLDQGGPEFSGAGRVFIPTHTYVIHHPVVLHANVEVDMASGALIEADGITPFSSGIVRLCSSETCAVAPVTRGETNVRLDNLHIRDASPGDVGANLYGFSDSSATNLLVDSTNTTVVGGIGTGVVLSGAASTGDYRNTFVNLVTRNVAAGVRLGTLGDANANTFLGGSLQGNPALEIAAGSGNAFWGTTYNGLNTTGDVLVHLDAGAHHNISFGNYYDDGLGAGTCTGAPCTATAIVVDAGASGNAFYGAHFDAEGGTLTGLNDHGFDTDFYALGPIAGVAATRNNRLFAGGGGNIYFTALAGAAAKYGFGNGVTAPNLAYGFAVAGSAPLSDGLEMFNNATANTANALTTNWYLNNDGGSKTLFGALQVTSIGIAAGAEMSSLSLQCRAGGAMATCLRFNGVNGFIAGTLAPATAGSASLGTSASPFASWCIGSGAGSACASGTFTAPRTILIPDAPSATAVTATVAAHLFLTGFSASSGQFTQSQPTAADLANGTVAGAGTQAANAVVLNSAMPLMATVSLGGSALAPRTCADYPVSIPGSTTAMAAVASPAGGLAGNWQVVQWSAFIRAADTVQIHLCNLSPASVTPAAQPFNVRVIQ